MKKKFLSQKTRMQFLFSLGLFLLCVNLGWGQSPPSATDVATIGDYRSLASGDWSTPGTWQVRTGVSTWATASAAPTATNTVYIQALHTVTLAGESECYSLHIEKSGILAAGENTVNVYGKLRCYLLAAPETGASDVYLGADAAPTTTAMLTATAGFTTLRFRGATRTFNFASEWSAGGTSPLISADIDLEPGIIITSGTAMKFSDLTLTAGQLNYGQPHIITGNCTIKTGAKIITFRNGTGTNVSIGNFYNTTAGALDIQEGGTLEFRSVSPDINFAAFINNGTVTYSTNNTAVAGFFMTNNDTSIANPDVNTYTNLIINNSAGVTATSSIKSITGVLNVSDNSILNADGFVTLKSTAAKTATIAPIGTGVINGNVTYSRNLPTSNWYLVSSPVSGQTYNDDYVTANSIESGTGSNRGIASYTTASNTWSYLQSAGSGTFNNGQGYSVKRNASGDISFTGTINTADVSLAVSNAGTGFNLIGNPFTAYLNSASFLTDNTGSLTSQTIWVFNQGSGNYETKVTDAAFVLAPGQGFFVRSSNGTNLNIAESYQASTGGTFQKVARTEVKLMMNDGTSDRFAKMYYLDNAKKGFDNGFDGETFGGIENTVDVFTNLVENNEGKKFQVQSLPIAEMETMIVTVGVKAAAGKEITFTAEALNLPGDTKVFLEDRLTNTSTRLDEANAFYKVTLNDALNGTGRFFLHTKASGVLSTYDLALSNTSVYATANNTLRVVGLPSGNATLKVFSVLGKQVVQTSFSSTGSYDISLPKLATGMYIVQLETAAGKLNKKIVLE
jgi:hypothetical protein